MGTNLFGKIAERNILSNICLQLHTLTYSFPEIQQEQLPQIIYFSNTYNE